MLSSCHAEGQNSIAAGIRCSELRLSGYQDVVWCVSSTVYAAVEAVGRIPRESLKHWTGAWMMALAGGGKRVSRFNCYTGLYMTIIAVCRLGC